MYRSLYVYQPAGLASKNQMDDKTDYSYGRRMLYPMPVPFEESSQSERQENMSKHL